MVRSSNRGERSFWRIDYCSHFGCFSRQSTSCKERPRANWPRPQGPNDIGRFPPKADCCVYWSGWVALWEPWPRSCQFSHAPLSQLSVDVISPLHSLTAFAAGRGDALACGVQERDESRVSTQRLESVVLFQALKLVDGTNALRIGAQGHEGLVPLAL